MYLQQRSDVEICQEGITRSSDPGGGGSKGRKKRIQLKDLSFVKKKW
jgi:hypothetical protein